MAHPPGNTHKLKVLTLVDYAIMTGGAERMAVQIATRLDPARFESVVCTTRVLAPETNGAAAAVAELQAAGVEVLPLDRKSRVDVSPWRSLFSYLRRERVDVIHSHKVGSNCWAAAVGRLARVPVIVAHEHSWAFEGQLWRRLLDRYLIAAGADMMVAVSSEDRRRMHEIERISLGKIRVVPNAIEGWVPGSGAEIRAGLGIAPTQPVVGTVAVLRQEKAIDVLLRAGSLLRDEFPELRIMVVGEGGERGKLEHLIDELGIAEMTLLLGFRADVPTVLAAFDVAVLSSVREGSPLAVMEYMEAGKPVVATQVGGIPDLITAHQHGLLVPPGDAVALASAIRSLVLDPERGRAMGERARERRRRDFGLDASVRKLERLYEELYEGSKRSRPTHTVPLPLL